MSPVLPGSTIGIFGGGQLGRMTAMAARSLGYDIHVLDPDPDCPARPVADRCITAPFDDAAAAADLASRCDVLTIEIEQVGIPGLEAAHLRTPVRPGPAVLAIVQDRAMQKRWLREKGFPLGDYREVSSASDIAAAARELGPLFVKAVRGGYDGRSQVRVARDSEAASASEALDGRRAVAEKAVDLEAELSVMVARRPSGDIAIFPVALNHHERQVLAWSVVPAPLPEAITERARELARDIALGIDLEGLLAVEMFLTRDGALLVNELAPRPHNSFHETEAACSTSQFEQLVRAVCDLPLGDPRSLRPAAIVNLFGDLWTHGEPAFAEALAQPGIRLHLYGKRVARPGRKMGHISAIGDTADDAVERARAAAALLAPGGS